MVVRDWTGVRSRRPVVSLVLAIGACVGVGSSGSVFTSMGLEWYRTLASPPLSPPEWVFGPVWTTLFVLMGIAAWLVWARADATDLRTARRARVALGVFIAHFLLNLGWSAAFFGLQSILAGLLVIVALWGVIVVLIALFERIDWRAGLLLVPYGLWVSFAAYLNIGYWVLQ